MKAYQADIAKFENNVPQVFGWSVDSVPDFKRTVVKAYGVFNEEQGFGNRATFLIDKEGIIRHIDEGNVAIDPTTVVEACNVLQRKKATQ